MLVQSYIIVMLKSGLQNFPILVNGETAAKIDKLKALSSCFSSSHPDLLLKKELSTLCSITRTIAIPTVQKKKSHSCCEVFQFGWIKQVVFIVYQLIRSASSIAKLISVTCSCLITHYNFATTDQSKQCLFMAGFSSQ